MKYLHLAIVALFGLIFMNRGNHDENIPDNFKDIYNPVTVFVRYNNPINGYTVKAIWHPVLPENPDNDFFDPFNGPEEIYFEKGDTAFSVRLECYRDDILSYGEYRSREYKDKEIVTVDNGEKYNSICFFDADFDGEDELVIDTWRHSQKLSTYKRIYEIHEDEAALLTQPPFDHIDEFVYFDADKNVITQYLRGMGRDVSLRRYKKHEINIPPGGWPPESEIYWELFEVVDRSWPRNDPNLEYEIRLTRIKGEDEFNLVKIGDSIIEKGSNGVNVHNSLDCGF